MLFGTDHTRLYMNPVAAKADPQALEDARCCLVGNSFHAGVVALLVAPLLVEEGFLTSVPTPDELVARIGLLPGEVFTEGLDCSLTRPPSYHRLDGQRRGHLYPSAAAARDGSLPRSDPRL